MWMSDVAMDVPPWIMVVMAYEKRALLWFPVPADSKFSRNTAKLVMLSLGCFSALRNQHVLWAMGISHNVVVINGSTVPPTTPTTTTTLGVNNVRSQFQSDDDVSKLVCDIGRNSYGIFLTMHRPWIDLMFRVVAPCSCLVVYNGSILWKIYREKFCATRLMRLAAIHPPDWFYLGVLEMEHAVKWTGTLTLFITVNSLPYSFYLICQPSSFVSTDPEQLFCDQCVLLSLSTQPCCLLMLPPSNCLFPVHVCKRVKHRFNQKVSLCFPFESSLLSVHVCMRGRNRLLFVYVLCLLVRKNRYEHIQTVSVF